MPQHPRANHIIELLRRESVETVAIQHGDLGKASTFCLLKQGLRENDASEMIFPSEDPVELFGKHTASGPQLQYGFARNGVKRVLNCCRSPTKFELDCRRVTFPALLSLLFELL